MENDELKKMMASVDAAGGLIKYRRKLLTEDHFMPSDLIDKKVGIVMTPGRIYYNIGERLKSGDCYASFPGANFHGRVWFDTTTLQYKCEIWSKKLFVGTIVDADLKNLRAQVCGKYGWNE